MIEDFRKEVENKLENGEKIKEDFIANNYEMLKECVTFTALSSSTLIETSDYSFGYHIIITNKRIFIGNLTPYYKIISYNVYDLKDIEDVTTDSVQCKIKTRPIMKLYYFLGISPSVICFYILNKILIEKWSLIENTIISNIVSLFIPVIVVYICYKLINNMTKLKLFANLKLKNGKEINCLLKKKENLEVLKSIKCVGSN